MLNCLAVNCLAVRISLLFFTLVCWKQPPEKTFRHLSRDKILHDSWSVSAASPIRHFERVEGPGDEGIAWVDLLKLQMTWTMYEFYHLKVTKRV